MRARAHTRANACTHSRSHSLVVSQIRTDADIVARVERRPHMSGTDDATKTKSKPEKEQGLQIRKGREEKRDDTVNAWRSLELPTS
eukprot:3851316-Pleurochrysis_carterae.AAC.1